MNMPDVPLLSVLRQRMSWLHQRQDVISQNVANADTPGYVARDLKPQDFTDILTGETRNGSALLATDPRHITMKPGSSSVFDDMEAPDTIANPNGNAVSLEREMIKVSETQAEFQAAANLYAKAMNMMKTAIGRV
ncbi:MAG TPA: flagellar basal body rod protein FlgB [Rhizomicrobium sp.]|jgi:flagellar basal-body rod protein FlgB|nr:flagellar basal body rod protein FlgB [Rhizomicrobium sp.]